MSAPREWLDRAQRSWEGADTPDASAAALAAAATGLLAAVVQQMDNDETDKARSEMYDRQDVQLGKVSDLLETLETGAAGGVRRVEVDAVITSLREALNA